MSEPLETMKVIDKENGVECIINASDYDPDKYEMVIGEEESGGDEAAGV